jgi:hypothetical protein
MRGTHLILPAALGLVVLSGCARPQPEFRMVATVEDLMEGFVEPTAAKLFEIGGWVSSSGKVEKIAPKDAEEWAAVKHRAMAVAEIGNVLKAFEPRAKEAEWTRHAQNLVDSAMAMSKAAETRNADAVFEAGGHLYDACTACHMKYLPQDQPPPPNEPTAPRQ